MGAITLIVCGVRGTAAEAVYPVENGRNWFSRHIGTRVRGLFTRLDLAVENRRLKEENAALRMELASRGNAAKMEAPHDDAREVAFLTNWIAAPVLSRSGTAGVGGYLRVGKGSLAGVKPGATVAVPEGGGATCVAAEADASILYVVNPFRIRHLQQRPDLPPRAKIITSGLGGVFPRGLVVGFLLDGQNADDTRLEREGDVISAVNFPALESVFIRRED